MDGRRWGVVGEDVLRAIGNLEEIFKDISKRE